MENLSFVPRNDASLTNGGERRRIAIEISGGEKVQNAFAILSFANDRKLFDEFSQRPIESITLKIEQFNVFFGDQLTKIIPGRRRRKTSSHR